MNDIITKLRAVIAKASSGPWWASGLDVESSHVVIASTTSTLGDRDVGEAQANADLIATFDPTTAALFVDLLEAADEYSGHSTFNNLGKATCYLRMVDTIAAIHKRFEGKL
jgi:hypothetical protein